MNVQQLFLGLALASAAGLRAFLPLLVLGLMARFAHFPLNEHFAWLAGTPALVILSVATIVEILGDKFPVVDHALDTMQTFVRPVAGALMVAGTQSESLDPTTLGVLAIVLGSPLAAGIHVIKGGARLVSTATTAGLANPVISIAEDIFALTLSLLAIFVPIAGAVLALVCMAAAYKALRNRRKLSTV